MALDRALLQDIVTIGSDGLFGMLLSRCFLIRCNLRTPASPTSLFGRFSGSTDGLTQNRNSEASSLGSVRRQLLLRWLSAHRVSSRHVRFCHGHGSRRWLIHGEPHLTC
jgi:hypothetical protein